MPQSDATGHPEHQAAAIDAEAGPGATAILQGMLETLSEVLGGLDQRLGRLEARLEDVAAGREATAEAVARLGTGMSQLVARLDELAREDDEPLPVAPPVEVDVDAVADAVAGRLDDRLSALSRLDRLDDLDALDALGALGALDGLDQRLAARLDQSDAALLDAVGERLAPLAGLAEEVAARMAGPVDGLGEGLRVVLARLGDLTESIDTGLGSLSEALSADGDNGDGEGAVEPVDVAAVVADESERVRSIVAGLGQAVAEAHADLSAAVVQEAHRTRETLVDALAQAEAARPDVIEAVAREVDRIGTVVAEEGERVNTAMAAAEPLGNALVARIEAVVAEAAAAIEQRYQAVSEALERLASSPPDAGAEVVERLLAAAQADLRTALDEAVLVVVDRQDAQVTAVRQAVDSLRAELAQWAESEDDAPDLGAVVAEATQASERSVARMHADIRGAVDDLARAWAERSSVADQVQGALHDLGERQEAYGAQVQQALSGLTQAVGALRGDLSSFAERPADEGPDVAVLLDRHAAEVRHAIEAVAAAIPPPPDVRGALDDALLVLADRQEQGAEELRQAIGRLRSELAALAESGDEPDGVELAALLARQAEEARGDLARLETVLRGQVAEVSGRAGSITDVIGRLDGRLHEVVDGVRALSRHLEATATLVPAVESLRAEVDELRRLYEQPRLRAVNGE